MVSCWQLSICWVISDIFYILIQFVCHLLSKKKNCDVCKFHLFSLFCLFGTQPWWTNVFTPFTIRIKGIVDIWFSFLETCIWWLYYFSVHFLCVFSWELWSFRKSDEKFMKLKILLIHTHYMKTLCIRISMLYLDLHLGMCGMVYSMQNFIYFHLTSACSKR